MIVVVMCLCKNNKQNDNHSENIRILGRQTLRWATAAYQDENPMIAVLHANYGVAYLSALKDIAREDEIESVLDVNMREIKKWVYNAQDSSTRIARAQSMVLLSQNSFVV